MTQYNEQELLDDILNTYVASATAPDHATLTEWIRRYPQYARELTEFAASWGLWESLPRVAGCEDVDEDTLVLRGMSIVQNILHEQTQRARDRKHPLVSILTEGAAHGLMLQEIAERTRLSVALVRKLDRRLILFASLPREAIELLARVIQRESDVVAGYLQQAPLLPKHASYRAEQAPRLARPEHFFDAVRADGTMTEANRTYWLAFAADSE